jgi:prolyl-tRNA synthetase
VRVTVDDRTDVAFGRRAVGWELKGIPLRVEIGPRDVGAQTAVLVRRFAGGARDVVPLADLAGRVPALLEETQREMLAAARRERDARITAVRSMAEVPEAVSEGWAALDWDRLGPFGELELASAGITVRCLQRTDGSMPESDAEPGLVAFLARAY